MEYYFTTVDGKPCSIPVPPKDMGDIERFHHDCSCQCAICAGVRPRMTPTQEVEQKTKQYQDEHPGTPGGIALRAVLAADRPLAARYLRVPVELPAASPEVAAGADVIHAEDRIFDARGGSRMEYSGRELGQKAAGDFLLRFKKEHRTRTRCSDEEAWMVTFQLNPGEMRTYLGLPGPSVDDALRRCVGQDVIVQDGGVNIVHRGFQGKKPGLGMPKDAAGARDRLRSMVKARVSQGREDALIDILKTDAGKELLDLILSEEE